MTTYPYPSIAKFADVVQLKDYRPPTKKEYVRYLRRFADHLQRERLRKKNGAGGRGGVVPDAKNGPAGAMWAGQMTWPVLLGHALGRPRTVHRAK